MDLICQNGLYPYKWVDVISKLVYIGQPPKSAFSSSLKKGTFLHDNHHDPKVSNETVIDSS